MLVIFLIAILACEQFKIGENLQRSGYWKID